MVDSDLKVGSSNAEGVYVKDTQLLQFDWSKLYDNLSYVWGSDDHNNFFFVIANLSTNNILLQRNGELTTVEAGKIDWYTLGGQGQNILEIQIFNEDANGNGTSKRVLEYYSTMLAEGESINYTYARNRIVKKGEIINDFASEQYKQFAYLLFVFNTQE